MVTQLFGNYLLNERYLSTEQLMNGLKAMTSARVKLGVLAINAGYLTADQVEEIHAKQALMDKRFGDIAVDLGYLCEEQVDELLKVQPSGYLALGQVLVDQGSMNNATFSQALKSYKDQYCLEEDDLNETDSKKSEEILKKFFSLIADKEESENFVTYTSLLFNNLVRFVGSDFAPFQSDDCEEDGKVIRASQRIKGEISFKSIVEGREKVFQKFASAYANEEFTKTDEYVLASLEDFLNLHNGLYTVNMSNEKEIELRLDPPVQEDSDTVEDILFKIPVRFSYGQINFIICK